VVGFDVTFSKPDDSAKPIRELRQKLEYERQPGAELDPRLLAQLSRVEAQYNADQQFADAIHRDGSVVLGNFFFMSPQEARSLDRATIEHYASLIQYFPFPQARSVRTEQGQGQKNYLNLIESYAQFGMDPYAAEANLDILTDALRGEQS